GALFDAAERLFDRLKNLGVGLLQFQLDVDFVVAAGLVGEIPLARVDVAHGLLKGLDAAARREDLGALLQQRFFVGRSIHYRLSPRGACSGAASRRPDKQQSYHSPPIKSPILPSAPPKSRFTSSRSPR